VDPEWDGEREDSREFEHVVFRCSVQEARVLHAFAQLVVSMNTAGKIGWVIGKIIFMLGGIASLVIAWKNGTFPTTPSSWHIP
jgi:hypothetical protein